MPTFGFSAFLKLILLSPKRQRTEIRRRISSDGSGYDFHRSLRLRAHEILLDGADPSDVMVSAEQIVRQAERKSAKLGLERLARWRGENPGDLCSFDPATVESPRGNFKVQFTCDFGVVLDGRRVAVHIWNTMTPELDPRIVYSALSLLPDAYLSHRVRPRDFGVLSLRDTRLYRLSEAGEDHASLGRLLLTQLDSTFEEVRGEGGPRRPTTKHPPTPSPPK